MIIRISKADEKYAYFMMTLILFTSGTVYANLYSDLADTVKVLITIIGLVVAFFSKDVKVELKHLMELIILCCGIFALGILNGSRLMGIIFFIYRIIGLFWFAVFCKSKKIDVFKVLFNIILVMAVFYLACYFVFESGFFPFQGEFVRITLGNESRLSNRTSLNYTCFCKIYYRWQSMSFMGRWTARNNGPFWEPGNYQIYLNYALAYYLFFLKKRKNLVIGTLIIAIVNTTSTAGIIMLCSILAVYFVSLKTSMQIKIVLIISCIVIAFIGADVFYGKTSTFSYDSRMKDSLNFFNSMDGLKWLFGNGYTSEKIRFNSMLIPIADFGILGVYIYYSFFRFIVKIKKNTTLSTLIILTEWWMLSLFVEPIIYLNISLLLFMEYIVVDKINI